MSVRTVLKIEGKWGRGNTKKNIPLVPYLYLKQQIPLRKGNILSEPSLPGGVVVIVLGVGAAVTVEGLRRRRRSSLRGLRR